MSVWNCLQAVEELAAVMSAELAHWSYVPFANFFGESLMEQSLKNHSLVKQLCAEYVLSCSQTGESIEFTMLIN